MQSLEKSQKRQEKMKADVMALKQREERAEKTVAMQQKKNLILKGCLES